jgi:predicted small lipoprotein YifL
MTRRVCARCLLACCLLLALAACGNKGPLYLPEEEKVEKQDSVNQSDSEFE